LDIEDYLEIGIWLLEIIDSMPKMKTRKCVRKRVKITAKKKVMHRKAGQGHFNSREAGKDTRGKRRDTVVFKTDAENIKLNLPYGN
jgi:ribosomal protein L35